MLRRLRALPWPGRPYPEQLSTGTKMLLILTAALLPLGLIAFFASIQSANAKQIRREADARVIATAEARQIDLLLLRGANLIRSELGNRRGNHRSCRGIDARARSVLGTAAGRFALFGADGEQSCSTPGFAVAGITPPQQRSGFELRIDPEIDSLRFVVGGAGGTYGVGELPNELLQQILAIGDTKQGIQLGRGDNMLVVSRAPDGGLFDRHVVVQAPIAGGQDDLVLELVSAPISATEVLLVLLPLLMWAAAAASAFVVVDQVLLRPLAQLQGAIAGWSNTSQPLILPRLTTPSREIKALGDAFQATTAELVRRELELEQGLSHQVRLTREVHHRVKNNLQVVASLINLHSRGTTGDVAAAYASIQRRVDALAVVHRNHYAELEENRGVALRSIIAELSANLRGSGNTYSQQLAITLDMFPAFVSQDVAVPVSFLVTEVVELVMGCAPDATVAIVLAPTDAPDRAVMTIRSAELGGNACLNHPHRERFERIVTGLSRQLRSQLEFDTVRGEYRIALAIVPQDGR